ncbi:hypothetical protein Pka01_44980 [Planotetraspora kaengkrachanensis]|uniref:Uncharacterized protein n=1 Tax=Planotetraspora kaengkrachanensis TaxID=575193 RepID=A0A8J3V700_9ACTN|nr:hypothetical protein Pka01_44980 [Planotetraspora kaengkrachanensis]
MASGQETANWAPTRSPSGSVNFAVTWGSRLTRTGSAWHTEPGDIVRSASAGCAGGVLTTAAAVNAPEDVVSVAAEACGTPTPASSASTAAAAPNMRTA